MDFELTNRQKQIRLAAREFAESELAPIGKECEAKGEFQGINSHSCFVIGPFRYLQSHFNSFKGRSSPC